jgi:hypothetical protein
LADAETAFLGPVFLILSEKQINDPAALRMRLLLREVLRQLGVARFEQGIVKGEGTVLAGIERLGELHAGRGPVRRYRAMPERVEHLA